MEDGAPAHRAKLTQVRSISFHSSLVQVAKTELKQARRYYYGIPSLVWPPYSPDLNPIENLCNLLKNRLNLRNPRPKGKAEVKAAVLEEWDHITEENIQKFVNSMPERI